MANITTRDHSIGIFFDAIYEKRTIPTVSGRGTYAIVSPLADTRGAAKNTNYSQRHQKNHPADVFRRAIVIVLAKLKHVTILPAVKSSLRRNSELDSFIASKSRFVPW